MSKRNWMEFTVCPRGARLDELPDGSWAITTEKPHTTVILTAKILRALHLTMDAEPALSAYQFPEPKVAGF